MEHPRIKLKPKTRVILLEWLFIIVSITTLMYLYYFMTWWGLRDYLVTDLFDGYVNSELAMLEIFIQGVLFGIMFGLINLLVDRSTIRRKSFGAIVFLKSILYILAMLLSQLAVFAIYHIFSLVPLELIYSVQDELSIRFIISMTVYFTFVILFITLILQINRKFGYGEMLAMLMGKYHKPRQERRIFMFLDMKDSTSNAERLGHYNYSRMIQSCMHDLTDIIIRYKAQVYQYVGDEVVLTWKTEKGVKDLNCINLFYAFEQRLHDRRRYYKKHYNTIPVFKAGLDEGTITVTEVGDIKREIAYHGDVLHTAARLEKMCNNLEKKILVTQKLISQFPSENDYNNELMGEFQLRGKLNLEKIYGMNR